LILGGAGIALLVIDRLSFPAGTGARNQDHLCMQTLAFVCLFATACAVLLGGRNLRTFLFPIAFLILTAPLPLALERGVESFLQHASAEASFVLLKLSGIPLLREGTIFILPGITLEVARECSGIHSTLVLFITAILAGQFFLRTTGGRITLAASVIVLGILRNAVRIFTLAQLTVHVDPNIIFSRLHRNGGPIFFAASLIPFFLLLWFLRKLEQRKRTDKPTGT
jgi:exosortase